MNEARVAGLRTATGRRRVLDRPESSQLLLLPGKRAVHIAEDSAYLACESIDVVNLLPRVRAPTLALHCRHDAAQPFEEGRQLAAGIPGAHFVELEGRNHLMLENDPGMDRFLEEVERFLRLRPRNRASQGSWHAFDNPKFTNNFQTYSNKDYETSGAFNPGALSDTSITTHEVAEWMNDLSGTNLGGLCATFFGKTPATQENRLALRDRWEYSHIWRARPSALALTSLTVAVVAFFE